MNENHKLINNNSGETNAYRGDTKEPIDFRLRGGSPRDTCPCVASAAVAPLDVAAAVAAGPLLRSMMLRLPPVLAAAALPGALGLALLASAAAALLESTKLVPPAIAVVVLLGSTKLAPSAADVAALLEPMKLMLPPTVVVVPSGFLKLVPVATVVAVPSGSMMSSPLATAEVAHSEWMKLVPLSSVVAALLGLLMSAPLAMMVGWAAFGIPAGQALRLEPGLLWAGACPPGPSVRTLSPGTSAGGMDGDVWDAGRPDSKLESGLLWIGTCTPGGICSASALILSQSITPDSRLGGDGARRPWASGGAWLSSLVLPRGTVLT